MKTPIYQVDAFTSRPFAGNPAAVCILKDIQPDSWMLSVAREMNLSETAFLLPTADDFQLRWLTPAVEVSLCGHATLASAHVLYTEGFLKSGETARFQTRSGLLTARLAGDWIELNFPTRVLEVCEPPPDLITALGIEPKFVGKSKSTYLVEVESEKIVRGISPDFARLLTTEARGVIVTSRASSPAYDFISRFFAPAMGINEDPVTGSAHCTLVPYWSGILKKMSFTAHQASMRGGDLRLRLEDDRVIIAGQAVMIFKGELII